MDNKYRCDVCQQEVEHSELYKIDKGAIKLIGHQNCLLKALSNRGLNESVADIKKTNFLLG
jgi:hypothetical protein